MVLSLVVTVGEVDTAEQRRKFIGKKPMQEKNKSYVIKKHYPRICVCADTRGRTVLLRFFSGGPLLCGIE